MKSFKKYLEERSLGSIAAAAAMSGAAFALPPKPEAIKYIVDTMKPTEKFRPVAEPDKDATGNPPVIGYGTTHVYPDTGKPIQVGERITPEEAERLMGVSIERANKSLEQIPGWDEMDAGKHAALMSFAYNVGPNFYGSSKFAELSDALKNKRWDEIPGHLAKYNKAGGEVLPGLVSRREEEGRLWSQGLPDPKSSHIIQPGDTLSAIAQKMGMRLPDLVAANPGINPNRLRAGQSINIRPKPSESKEETPKAETPKAEGPTTTRPTTAVHVVKPGDTLSAIAKQQGRSLQDLLKANPDIKDPNKISPGQRIR